MEWQAHYEETPWGDDWQQAATIAVATLSPWTKKKLNPQDFIPGRQRKRRQSPGEVAARLKLFFDAQKKRTD